MSKQSNQKQRILYVRDYLLENTDENHNASTKEISTYLKYQGITADSRTIVDDINVLREYGLYILGERKFYVARRDFELPELQLLMDSVFTSKVITENKTEQIISKLARLCSKHEAKMMRGKIYHNRVKSTNESIHYNVFMINEAIQRGSLISFKYLQYTLQKDMSFRRDGKSYKAIPLAFIYSEDFYYLLARNTKLHGKNNLKHYRIDKMKEVSTIPSCIQPNFGNHYVDLAQYTKQTFSMFGGEVERVTIQFENSLIGVVVDKFGNDIAITKVDDKNFSINVPVAVSGQFFSWLFAFGDKVKILKPDNIVKEYRKMLKDVSELYKDKRS